MVQLLLVIRFGYISASSTAPNENLEQHLWEVSDPRHPRYGEFFTPSQLNGLLKPTSIALQLV
jgi:hypothetical protein